MEPEDLRLLILELYRQPDAYSGCLDPAGRAAEWLLTVRVEPLLALPAGPVRLALLRRAGRWRQPALEAAVRATLWQGVPASLLAVIDGSRR